MALPKHTESRFSMDGRFRSAPELSKQAQNQLQKTLSQNHYEPLKPLPQSSGNRKEKSQGAPLSSDEVLLADITEGLSAEDNEKFQEFRNAVQSVLGMEFLIEVLDNFFDSKSDFRMDWIKTYLIGWKELLKKYPEELRNVRVENVQQGTIEVRARGKNVQIFPRGNP